MIRRSIALLALSCGACSRAAAETDARVAEEIERRETFSRALLADAGAEALRIRSSPDVQFEEGFSLIQLEPLEKFDGHAYRWIGQRAHVRLRTSDAPMQLRFVGWADLHVVHTTPQVNVYVDAFLVGKPAVADDQGFFIWDTRIDPWIFRGRRWIDVTIELSSIGYHWQEPPELRAAHVFEFSWKKAE